MKKMTIGVPVYNAEKYLCRCLDSLLRQGIEPCYYEILCIDDGSKDSSWQIMSEYKQSYPEIFTILQNNKNIGLAQTRNRIIENAQGYYLGFVDADDYVIDGAFAYLSDFIVGGIDVLQYSMITLDEYVLKNNLTKTECSGGIKFDGYARTFLERGLPTFIQVLLIRLDYLHKNNLRLLDTRYCEDPLFILRLYMTNPRLRYVYCDAYRYTVNQNQMSRERDPRMMQIAIKSYMTFLGYLVKFRDECTVDEEKLRDSINEVIKGQLHPFISRALCANINRNQYKEIRKTLKDWKVVPTSSGIYAKAINIAFTSYLLYCPLAIFHKRFFVPYILPRMNKN